MPTILSFLSGRQITNNSGVPQAGAKLYHYRENTTTNLPVWTNDIATVAHPQPVPCDAGGFVPLIYVDDTFDWKVVIKTSTDVTLQTYDNLAKAESASSSAAFAPPLLAWTQVTNTASPVALTVNDAGKAYEADTTSGSIEFDLPSAASVGNGKGFWFKKTAAANSLVIDPSGSETVDDISTSISFGRQYQVLFIVSNGAEWYVAASYLENVASERLPAASDTAQGALEIATQAEMVTATDLLRAVVPGRQKHHPAHPKAWARWTPNTTTILQSSGVSSVSSLSGLVSTVNFSTAFAAATYGIAGWVQTSDADGDGILSGTSSSTLSTTSAANITNRHAGDASTPTTVSGLFIGDQ